MHGDPIKYEVDKETGAVFVDRFMSTSMHYPCNYGYIPRSLGGDGDPCDVLVLSPVDLEPGKWVCISSWTGPEEAKQEVLDSVARYESTVVAKTRD